MRRPAPRRADAIRTPGAGAAALLLLTVLAGACRGVGEATVPGPVSLTPATTGSQVGRLTAEAGAVELHYLGVGGWVVRTRRSILLTGTLLSRPSLLEVGLGARLAPDGEAIERGLRVLGAPPLDDAVAILLGHGHYDHALDVPWLLAGPAPRARVLTNRTAQLQLTPFARVLGFDPDRIEDVGARAADHDSPGEWIQVAPDLRVLPVAGDHAPHIEGQILFSGIRRSPLPGVPGPAAEWLDGASISFLVDVLNPDGSVGLRIYYEDAIPREPAGLIPPPEILGDSIPVDIAFLVPNSFAQARWYPEFLLQNLRPKMVLVEHWEDFFRPVTDPVRPLVLSNVAAFLSRTRRIMGCAECVLVPEPGARLSVPPLGSGGPRLHPPARRAEGG